MAAFGLEIMHTDPPPAGDIFWYKTHALVLYIAFAVLFPLGVTSVRYGRYHPRRSHWFQYHWALQSVGVLFVTGGISIALRKFVDCRNSVHRQIGLSLAFFVLVQPVLALFRPARGEPLRYYWEFSHWVIGTAGIVVGWINIFKGLDLYFSIWPETQHQCLLVVLFAIQVFFMTFGYLLFDRNHREKPDCHPDDNMVPLLKKPTASAAGQFLARV